MKFIHSADWQLGKSFGRFDADVRSALGDARFDAIDSLGNAAAEHGARHVLVAGDVFDTEGPDDRTIVQALSRMGRHACNWWLLPGNHDSARNGGLWDRLRHRADERIAVLTAPEPKEIEPGVWLLPAPLEHRHNVEDPTERFDAMETPGATLRIGLAHGSIRDFGSQGETKNKIAPDRARRSHLDYLALGDWHGALRVNGRTWYAGTPETDKFQRDDPGHALVVDLSPDSEPVVTAIRTGRFQWLMRDWMVGDEAAFNAECDLLLSAVETILNNPFYTGVIRMKRSGMTYRGVHERIIAANLFERVQVIKSGKAAGPKVTRHDHTYRGLFSCGHCAGPMVPELQKGHVYYRCQARECPTKTVREEAIEAAIEACLLRSELSAPDMDNFTARIEAWIAADEDQEREKGLQLRKANIQDRTDRLTDALIDRLIDREAFADRRQRLALEEEALDEERRELGDKVTKAEHMRTLIELANSLVRSHRLAETSEKRQLVEMTTSNRHVAGKSIYLEPSNWLDEIENTLGVQFGGPDRDKDRRG